MKRFTAPLLALALFALLALASCRKTQGKVVKEPPALELEFMSAAGAGKIRLAYGTASWFYDNGNGTHSGFASDGPHPLDGNLKNVVQAVSAEYFAISKEKSISARVRAPAPAPAPDDVRIVCWSEACLGDYSAEGEVLAAQRDGDGAWGFRLKDGSYVYEVVATWNNEKNYGGTASYVFYADVSEEAQVSAR